MLKIMYLVQAEKTKLNDITIFMGEILIEEGVIVK